MTVHAQPSAADLDPIPPVDRFDAAVMRRYRLLPFDSIPDGFLIYADASGATVAISSPKKHKEPPVGTDTIMMSAPDYRRVTKAIVDVECS